MRAAHDYAVAHPYGAIYSPWSVRYPHRGNDRSTPSGTPVVIAGVTIGLTGDSGKVTGPHLHTQAGTDSSVQQTVDPTPHEFKPGLVTAIRPVDAGEWGKFVTIKTGSHYVTYAHLSEVYVEPGQVIQGEAIMNEDDAALVYPLTFYRQPESPAVVTAMVGKRLAEVGPSLMASKEYGTNNHILHVAYPHAVRALGIKDKEIARLQAELAAVGGDTELLNTFGKALAALIRRLGLSK